MIRDIKLKHSFQIGLIVAVTAVGLTGCATSTPTVTGSITPSPSGTAGVVAGATAAAPGVMTAVNAVSPTAIAKITAVCPSVLSGLSIAQSCVSGGAAGTTGAIAQLTNIATASCGNAAQLAVNDALPPSPSNSGNSAAFLAGLLNTGAALAPIGCPIAKMVF